MIEEFLRRERRFLMYLCDYHVLMYGRFLIAGYYEPMVYHREQYMLVCHMFNHISRR